MCVCVCVCAQDRRLCVLLNEQDCILTTGVHSYGSGRWFKCINLECVSEGL